MQNIAFLRHKEIKEIQDLYGLICMWKMQSIRLYKKNLLFPINHGVACGPGYPLIQHRH
jgi:hypothetical protein